MVDSNAYLVLKKALHMQGFFCYIGLPTVFTCLFMGKLFVGA